MTRIHVIAATTAALLALSGGAFYLRSSSAQTKGAAGGVNASPQALPVPVAVIEELDLCIPARLADPRPEELGCVDPRLHLE